MLYFLFSDLINFEELLRVAEQWVVGNQDFDVLYVCLFLRLISCSVFHYRENRVRRPGHRHQARYILKVRMVEDYRV